MGALLRIILERKNSDATVLLSVLFLMFAGATSYAIFAAKELYLGAGVAAIGVVAILLGYYLLPLANPILVIDDDGVFDARLGVGKIAWTDVEDVQIQAIYGNRFLCLRLREPERYLAKLKGPKKQKVLSNRELGFERFNIDVGPVPVSMLEIKKMIEKNKAP